MYNYYVCTYVYVYYVYRQMSQRDYSRESDLSIDALSENGTWESFKVDEMSGDYFLRVRR